jgi:hypothetical protein
VSDHLGNRVPASEDLVGRLEDDFCAVLVSVLGFKV